MFGEQKEKFKQLPGLGNRRSLFWVRSSAVPSSLWREKNEEAASEARHTHIFFFFSREERNFLGENSNIFTYVYVCRGMSWHIEVRELLAMLLSFHYFVPGIELRLSGLG